jgi:hypothetical protein
VRVCVSYVCANANANANAGRLKLPLMRLGVGCWVGKELNAKGLQAIRAGDIGAPGQETWLDKTIGAMNPQTPAGERDKNYDAFQGLSKSMGFSLATMVGSIVGASAGAAAAGSTSVATRASRAVCCPGSSALCGRCPRTSPGPLMPTPVR